MRVPSFREITVPTPIVKYEIPETLSNEILEKIIIRIPQDICSLVCKNWHSIYNEGSFAMEKIRLIQKELGLGSFISFTDQLSQKPSQQAESLKRVILEECLEELSDSQRTWVISNEAPLFKSIEFLSIVFKAKNFKAFWNVVKSDITFEGNAKIGKWMLDNPAKFVTITKLNLSRAHLSYIPKELQLFSSLESLHLNGCSITKISGKLLNCFKNMKFFSMETVGLRKLPKRFGETWDDLESLCLGGNYLKKLPTTFSTCWPKLSCIRLGSNNLEELPQGFGAPWTGLKHFSIGMNNLTSLPVMLLKRGKQMNVFNFDADKISTFSPS